jgi:hypothetical protein
MKMKNWVLWLIGAVLLLLIAVTVPRLSQKETTPCSPEGFLGSCYRISEDACLKAWTSIETNCSKNVAKELGRELRPGEMLGPKVVACQKKYYDKAFYYVRRTDKPEECGDYFNKMDEYR